jgi:two-component system, cell cycle sensor histidine kinase and response regulator CckA
VTTDVLRARRPSSDTSRARGKATILLVEDEDAVRGLVSRVLESAGYRVLDAGRPSEAEPLFAAEPQIDLLVTDVVMPEMSGYELAQRFQAKRPSLRTLFISGYSENAPSSLDGVTGDLLKKPFAPEQLTRAVERALEAGSVA